MLRRRTSSATATPADEPETAVADQGTKLAGKGRPTPKRSEVERARRQPYTAPPKNRKEAAAQDREHRRAEQKRRMDAMREGKEWALPAKDRGPVRALARDYIDSRKFVVSEYILFGVFALILLVFLLGRAKNSAILLYIEIGILAVIAIESLYHGSRVISLAKRRFPGESTRGVVWYIAKRSLRLRGSRIPPTRVGRGEEF
ncbi:MAG TPA: DUF3043 domain-containing protein [Streptosporangiaceae bacterium]|nr:DUF3043 domain-containing protein [Streptosporangiaceae bacterium]